MPFTFSRLEIPDVILVKPHPHLDDRGFFVETYKRSEFVEGGVPDHFVQDNRSYSTGPVLRGLHYQKNPAAQAKLVSVIRGRIFDVAVDIRRGSPTYGLWVSAILSSENQHMLYVPQGFAHGFCVFDDEADVVYKVTSEFSPQHDRGIVWNDPDLGIDWPIADPVLSARDAGQPTLGDADINFVYPPGG